MKLLLRLKNVGDTKALFRRIFQSSAQLCDVASAEKLQTCSSTFHAGRKSICNFPLLATCGSDQPQYALSSRRQLASSQLWSSPKSALLNCENCLIVPVSSYSTKPSSENNDDKVSDSPPQRIGILQRFKSAYKQYGKVLIVVHCATSAIWFSSFYYAALSGVDVVPLLEKIGVNEMIIQQFQSSGIGNIAVAYLLYKLATPVRYTVTIGGTQATVKTLRRFGYMKPVPEGDSLRELMKQGRAQVKDKIADRKEEWKDKADDIRDKIKDRTDDMKDKVKKHRTKANQ